MQKYTHSRKYKKSSGLATIFQTVLDINIHLDYRKANNYFYKKEKEGKERNERSLQVGEYTM